MALSTGGAGQLSCAAFFVFWTMNDINPFWYVDMATLATGRPFAGFATGDYEDMHGRRVTWDMPMLESILANTRAAIASMQSKGLPGLPIDARNHDKGEAAGWIVEAEQGSITSSTGEIIDAIMLAAQWTKLGIELIGEKIMAGFSPTIDLTRKVIRGGSLTNWPALKDAAGIPLSNALELCEGVTVIAPPVAQGELIMLEMSQEQLDERIAAAVATALDKVLDTAPSVEMVGSGDELSVEMQQRIAAHVQAAEQRAIARMEQEFAAQRRRSELAEFATQVTAGTPNTPRALPVAGNELLAFMTSLNESQAATARKMLTAIWENGLVEFGEIGHGRDMRRGQKLDRDSAAALRQAIADGHKPAQWFALFPELGDQSQYDLSEFEGA